MSLWFGGDYNPEQWPREVWDEDVVLMRRAGVTVATVAVFAWARLEPRDGEFDFGWLDEVIERLWAAGVGVDLATATASPPPWLIAAHPDMLPVTADGVRLGGGSRQHYSPHSASYRRYAARLVGALAGRYGRHPALVAWHVGNEYGCHVARCYSEEGAAAFRRWLARRYGDVEALNAAWGTDFWSQRYGSFDEIEPPRAAPTFLNPTQLLDFDRFSSEALLDLFRMEAAILRELSPGVPVTTNFMGAFKQLDYWRWAREVDIVSDDLYPDPADARSAGYAALCRDLMRSLGGGRPWILMEQAPSAVSWRARNAPKAPGTNRLHALQAISRGADGIMHFQWRQSVHGAEKFHSAMVPHAGPDSRVFREAVALGEELRELAPIEGREVPAEVAIVFDWESWWAIEQPAGPAVVDYLRLVLDWHSAFVRAGVTIDFVRAGASLGGYRIVVAPALFATSADALRILAEVPARGGQLVVGFQTGILDETLRVHDGGYLGPLRDALGVSVEEFAPLAHPDQFGDAPPLEPETTVSGAIAGSASLWTEVVHAADGVEVLSRFDEGIAAGGPAVTLRRDGDGAGWYVATRLHPPVLDGLLGRVLDAAGVVGEGPLPDGVEVVRRGDWLFVLNHGDEGVDVPIAGGHVAPRDAVIIRS